jgi:hypothetical protein
MHAKPDMLLENAAMMSTVTVTVTMTVTVYSKCSMQRVWASLALYAIVYVQNLYYASDCAMMPWYTVTVRVTVTVTGYLLPLFILTNRHTGTRTRHGSAG